MYPVAERLQAKGVGFAFHTAWDGEIDTRYSHVPVLRKPFSLTELERCLRALLGGRLKLPNERPPHKAPRAKRGLGPTGTPLQMRGPIRAARTASAARGSSNL